MKAPLRLLAVVPIGTRNNVHETSSQENNGVDKTNNPLIANTFILVKTELFRKREIGTVGTSLIPSLCRGSNGAQRDGVPEHLGAVPLVISLVLEGLALALGELFDHVESFRVTSDEGCAAEELGVLGHAVAFCEEACIEDGFFGGYTLERSC